MGKYGQASVIAIKLINDRKKSTPREAWDFAVAEVFPHSESSRIKGCPRGTFLGLCEKGLLYGVKPGDYTRSSNNKGYAVKAVSILKSRPNLVNDKKKLWQMVLDGGEKTPNSQMDVVTTLWSNNLINKERL